MSMTQKYCHPADATKSGSSLGIADASDFSTSLTLTVNDITWTIIILQLIWLFYGTQNNMIIPSIHFNNIQHSLTNQCMIFYGDEDV